METTQIINGITAKIDMRSGKLSHLKTFKTVEDAVSYMTRNEVTLKCCNIANDNVSIKIEQTEEAQENWYKNEMRIDKFSSPGLPTNMWK